MSNSKKVREAILRQAGYELLAKCNSCQHVSRFSDCNNLQCPLCGANMRARGWMPPKPKLSKVGGGK